MDFIPEHIPDSDRVGVLKALDKALESGEAMDPEFRDLLEVNRHALLDAMVHIDTDHGEIFSVFLDNLIRNSADDDFPDFPPISETSLPEMFEEFPDVLGNTKLSDEQIRAFPQLLLDQPQKALILGWFSADVRLLEFLFSYYIEDPHSTDSSNCIPLLKFIVERFPHSPQGQWLMSQVQENILLPQTENVLCDLFSLYVCLRNDGGVEGNNARILQRIFGILDKVSYSVRSMVMENIIVLGDRDAVLGLRSLYVNNPGLRKDIEGVLKEWRLPQTVVDQYVGSAQSESEKLGREPETIFSFDELS